MDSGREPLEFRKVLGLGRYAGRIGCTLVVLGLNDRVGSPWYTECTRSALGVHKSEANPNIWVLDPI